MIAVDGRKCWTLFDSGARNTYVTPSVAELLNTTPTPRLIHTALGGAIKETSTAAVLNADIEGHAVSTYALVVDNIGKDEDGNAIDILFGGAGHAAMGNQTQSTRRETRSFKLPRRVRGILTAIQL